jgi:hypothetical protein
MKRRHLILCLLVALLLPASIVIFRPADRITAITVKLAERSPAPPTNAASKITQGREETVQQFLKTMDAWETASGLEGDRLEEQLRNAITDENAEGLLRAMSPRFHGTYVGNLLLERWAAQDRGGALQWLATQNNPTLFEVNAVTKNWSVQDSEGLERYVDNLPRSVWKNLVLESTGRDALTNKDPELAFSLLHGMDNSPAKIPLLANAVQQWAHWDPRSAVAEINKFPDPVARERLILAVASGYAFINPDAAADWLRQSFPEGSTLDRGLAGVMQAWTSAGNPASAAQWVTKLPAGRTRDHALRELISAWNHESPEMLKNWLSNLPEGSMRVQADAALSSLASSP